MRASPAVTPLASAIGALRLSPGHDLVKGPDGVLKAGALPGLASNAAIYSGQRLAIQGGDPFRTCCAMLALDGQAEAMMPLPSGLSDEAAARLTASAGTGRTLRQDELAGFLAGRDAPDQALPGDLDTRWLLATSGTTGPPRTVRHTRASIVRAVRPCADGAHARWGMLYDPARFAGTQVLAQALLSGGTLLVPDPVMDTAATIDWLAEEGCTHLSATPSLWRRLLMAPGSARLPLRQVTLGGEIADGAILSALHARFPDARIVHIYASTEVGTGFAVRDMKAGFPARCLHDGIDGAGLSVRDGMLWVRPPVSDLTAAAHIERDGDGFIRTGDRVAVEGDRVLFLGREDSMFNVGGVKIQAEEVEEVVHAHPAVARCRVVARPSALTGSLLALSIVPRSDDFDDAVLRRDVARWCRERLPPAARPASIRIVADLPVTAAGKLSRTDTP